MQQLTGLDTSFLSIETATTFGHISGLAIFDPSTAPDGTAATIDDVKQLIMDRIHLLPPDRRRLVEVPFGLDHPYWIEDPDFDLGLIACRELVPDLWSLMEYLRQSLHELSAAAKEVAS